MSKYTIQLFRHLLDNLPPHYPDELAEDMRKSVEEFENKDEVSLEKVEQEMIRHGFFVWPYYKAHRDFLEEATEKMGHHFLEPYFDDELKDKYSNFIGYGGSWQDLYSGRAANFFNEEERLKITEALIGAKSKLKDYVERDVHGINRDKYMKRVQKYHFLLDEMKDEIENLRKLADKEDHDILAEQIKSKVRDIEYSFAHLGQELEYHEIFNAVDFFIGRKQKLTKLRGIDVPRNYDFYN